MGEVICKEHGGSSGPLACEHILAAVEKGAQMPLPCAVTLTFEPEVPDVTVGSVICEACAEAWSLTNGCDHPFPDSDEAFPWVAPCCGRCYRTVCARQGRPDRMVRVARDAACDEVSIEELRTVVERAFQGSKARFLEAVEVHETLEGGLAWNGTVKIFEMTATRNSLAYAWSYLEQGKGRRFMHLCLEKAEDPAEIVRRHGWHWMVERSAV